MKSIQLFDPSHGINAIINMEGEMSSLTDLWKAAGEVDSKRPNDWITRNPELIDVVSNMLNATRDGIIKTRKGKGGGTWAHKQIALSYAKYLSPELAVIVNQVFFERIEEEKNPEKIFDRGIETYKRKGKSEDWIKKRLDSKLTRGIFTAVLSEHGVHGKGYAKCTNGIYGNLFGGNTQHIREKKNLPEKTSVRDNLSVIELDSIKFAESLAAEKIRLQNLHGNEKCIDASCEASSIVAKAVNQYLKA